MELKEVLESKLNKLGDNIDAKLNEYNEHAEQMGDDLKKEFKGEIEELIQKYNAQNEKLEKLQEQANELEKINSRLKQGKQAQKTWADMLTDQIKNTENFSDKVKTNTGISFDMKERTFFDRVKVDLDTGSNYTGDVIQPDYQPGIVFDPDRATHVRAFLSTGTTSSDTIRFIQETSFTDNTSTVGEGVTKPQNEFDLTAQDAPVRKIANYVRMSEEMLDDTAGLRAYLVTRLPKKVMVEEDNQILYGDNTGTNLNGITNQAAAYTDDLADSNVNRYDVLVKAVAQVRDDEYMANAIMINPDDWYDMLLIKDGQGMYVFPENARFGGNAPRIAGVPLIANTAVTSGDFLAGDFNLGAQLFDRMQSRIRFFEQDQDNAITNKITVVAEERIALPVYRPSAFVYGDFASALAQGSA